MSKKFSNHELKIAITFCLFQNNNDLWNEVNKYVDNPSYYLFLYYYNQIKESPNHFNLKIPKIKYKINREFCINLLNDMINNYQFYDKNIEIIPVINLSLIDLINLYDISSELIINILNKYKKLSILTWDTINDVDKKNLVKNYIFIDENENVIEVVNCKFIILLICFIILKIII